MMVEGTQGIQDRHRRMPQQKQQKKSSELNPAHPSFAEILDRMVQEHDGVHGLIDYYRDARNFKEDKR